MCAQCDQMEVEENRQAKAGSLRDEAVALLASLPRQIRTCQTEYSIALALEREGLVGLSGRTVLGNGQVRYDVRAIVVGEDEPLEQACADHGCDPHEDCLAGCLCGRCDDERSDMRFGEAQ